MKKNKITPLIVTTSRLLIRPHQFGDEHILNRAIVDSFESLHKWMVWAKEPQTLAQTRSYIEYSQECWGEEPPPELPLLIFDRSGKKLLGASGFNAINWSAFTFDIGYWGNIHFSGEGYITEAVNALTRYAFTQWGAKRVEIRCDSENVQSVSIPQRLNFLLAARLKDPRVQFDPERESTTLLYAKYDLENMPEIELTFT